MTDVWLLRALQAAVLAALYVCGFLCLYHLLKAVSYRRPRWLAAWLHREEGRVPDSLLRLVGLSRTGASVRSRADLLLGCGFGREGDAAAVYSLLRRLLLGIAGILLAAAWRFGAALAAAVPAVPLHAPTLLLAGICAALLWDKPILEAVRRYRAQRIVKEIHIVSSQLLYYAGSSLHIHTKLARCLPYTTVIRGDLQRLLGEWYHDAGAAVRRFGDRLGTAEGAGFAETVESLRLHEDETYYELLRERIEDYKAKLELMRESRKESASYVLFALAGVPILYMFQIFIYPWVQEGQKLFQSLNP